MSYRGTKKPHYMRPWSVEKMGPTYTDFQETWILLLLLLSRFNRV